MGSNKTPAREKNKTSKIAPEKQADKRRRNKPEKNRNAIKNNRLELLFVIINRNKTDYYIDLLESFDVNLRLITLGHGTADANMLALLRLNDSDKAVLMGVIRSDRIKDALATLDEKFKTVKGGNGIAYTVPMTGVIGALIFGFLSNNGKTVKDGERKQ